MICLHNLPDGLTIGAAYASTDFVSALALVTGTAIRDVPEGMVVALALRCAASATAASLSRVRRYGFGVLSSLLEPVMATLGAAIISLSASFPSLGRGSRSKRDVVCHQPRLSGVPPQRP